MSNISTDSPYSFSRGSVQLTSRILKKRSPSLALEVQNILGQKVVSNSKGANDSRIADCFECHLDSFQVRSVVEQLHLALTGAEMAMQTDESRAGEVIMIKSLTDDWLSLATAMIEDLRKNESL